MWPNPIGKCVLFCCITRTRSFALCPIHFFVSPRNEESLLHHTRSSIDETSSIPSHWPPSMLPVPSSPLRPGNFPTPTAFFRRLPFRCRGSDGVRSGQIAGAWDRQPASQSVGFSRESFAKSKVPCQPMRCALQIMRYRHPYAFARRDPVTRRLGVSYSSPLPPAIRPAITVRNGVLNVPPALIR